MIDIGAGAGVLVAALAARGLTDLAALDLSETALAQARARLAGGPEVDWIVADVLGWRPARRYDIWHDRAAFHFLTDPADRQAYRATLAAALAPGGHAVLGTFAPDGPERCSGLPVVRYDADSLAAELGPGFRLIAAARDDHRTPAGALQRFQFGLFRKL